MGLFGGDDGDDIDDTTKELLDAARHDSVTAERLTELKPGRVSRYLYDEPLVEYLEEGEQPHFILAARDTAPSATGGNAPEMPTHSGTGMAMHMLTDRRWLTVTANSDGDQTLDIPLGDIRNVDYDLGGHGSHEITISLEGGIVTVPIANIYDDADIEAAGEYLAEFVEPGSGETTEQDSEAVSGIETETETEAETEAETETVSETSSGTSLVNIDPETVRNDTALSEEMLLNIDGNLKSDETVHYAYSINAAERGDDHMGGLTTGGCLLATDRRLTAYINETIGSSNLSISYDRIDTVEIEHGAMITKLSVQSTSKTYSFPGFNNTDAGEIQEFADFIRDRADDAAAQSRGGGSEADPTEQLKNIKELHDQGVLTDEEFEEKKQSLLEKF